MHTISIIFSSFNSMQNASSSFEFVHFLFDFVIVS